MKKKLTLYHNGGCSKSRAVLELLRNRPGIELEVIEYLTQPPTPAILDQLLNRLGLEPQDIVRAHEDEYEALGLDRTPPNSRAKWLEVLTCHPILIERPILTDGTRAVIGRPPERALELV